MSELIERATSKTESEIRIERASAGQGGNQAAGAITVDDEAATNFLRGSNDNKPTTESIRAIVEAVAKPKRMAAAEARILQIRSEEATVSSEITALTERLDFRRFGDDPTLAETEEMKARRTALRHRLKSLASEARQQRRHIDAEQGAYASRVASALMSARRNAAESILSGIAMLQDGLRDLDAISDQLRGAGQSPARVPRPLRLEAVASAARDVIANESRRDAH